MSGPAVPARPGLWGHCSQACRGKKQQMPGRGCGAGHGDVHAALWALRGHRTELCWQTHPKQSSHLSAAQPAWWCGWERGKTRHGTRREHEWSKPHLPALDRAAAPFTAWGHPSARPALDVCSRSSPYSPFSEGSVPLQPCTPNHMHVLHARQAARLVGADLPVGLLPVTWSC